MTAWEERPETVRALLFLHAISIAMTPFVGGPVPRAVFGMLVAAAFTYGLWIGNRVAWLLALVGAVTSLAFGLTSDPRPGWYFLAVLALTIALLLAPSTRAWVKRSEAAERRRAAPPA
jgi:hypothetical protein